MYLVSPVHVLFPNVYFMCHASVLSFKTWHLLAFCYRVIPEDAKRTCYGFHLHGIDNLLMKTKMNVFRENSTGEEALKSTQPLCPQIVVRLCQVLGSFHLRTRQADPGSKLS